jgi:nitrogen regulatory protein PII
LVQLIAVVKPFRAKAVLAALEAVEIKGGSVREVMGFGRQKHRLARYLGSEYNASFLPKVELTLFLENSQVQAAIRAIVGQARTGRIGDGKILILPCLDAPIGW